MMTNTIPTRASHNLLPTLVLGALLGAPAFASAGGPVEDVLSRIGNPALVRAVSPALHAAEDEGLPLGLLTSKALEGAAKNVPPPIVGRVLNRLVDNLRTAQAALPASIRSNENIEALARASLAGCAPEQLLSVLPTGADALRRDGGQSLRRVSGLCSDLRAAGLISSQSGVLAVNTVRYAPGDADLDGVLVRTVREAGSAEAAGALATTLTIALSEGGGIQGAVGQVLANHPIAGDGPPNSNGNGPPETLNSKAAERAGPPDGVGSKGNGSPPETPPGKDPDFVPPGQDKDKTPPGQDKDKTPPGQDKKG